MGVGCDPQEGVGTYTQSGTHEGKIQLAGPNNYSIEWTANFTPESGGAYWYVTYTAGNQNHALWEKSGSDETPPTGMWYSVMMAAAPNGIATIS
jgi:hypothetical protein